MLSKVNNKEVIVILKPQGSFDVDWQETALQLGKEQNAYQEKLYQHFQGNADEALFNLGFSKNLEFMSESVRYLRLICATYVKKLSENAELEILREKTNIIIEEDEVKHLLQVSPYISGAENLDCIWIENIWSRLNKIFCKMIGSYEGSVTNFFAYLSPSVNLVGRVFFHLVESKKEEYPFAFLATYAAKVSKDGVTKYLPLKNALIEYEDNSKKLLQLLSTVNKAATKSAFVAQLVESGDIFHPIGLTASEAYTFLKEIPIYEEAGILSRIPNWWKNKSQALKISVSVGDKTPSRVDLNALVDFDAKLYLGEIEIDSKELRELLSEAEGLTFIKGKWVEVNHKKLSETLKAYKQAQKLMEKTDISMIDAMRFKINSQKIFQIPEDSCEFEVTNGQWLSSVVNTLTHPDTIESITGGEDFHASLRVYQKRGLNWLNFMKDLGLGACLADDMGLGKTVQVIALLNYIRTKKHEKALLIVPASLIGNWTLEILKFAPSIKYYVVHPSENKNLGEDYGSDMQKYDLFITTYGMILKYDWIKDITWDTLILDEAQAIKNPATKQTRGVKQLKASYKIAMTGTPIENRLFDLWSLFDFLNKGLLGTAKEFKTFTKKLSESGDGYARLKQVVSPFILRRLKTDKTVISDLPEKIEMKTYATLTKKQVVLYNKLVYDLKSKLESADEGLQRKGLVLSSLMKFKQICNHPDQYLGQKVYAPGESGKYERLREICETIYDKRERVIIFTQFKEMTQPLKDFLQTIFHHEGLVLNGETSVGKRKDIVAKFQSAEYVPFLVLSIKAGGVGLNLTSANHVIHFDRWWNPAVENQATDRAFRIGQKKNVIVHKFITKGTIEERIDLMIEDKTKLSKEIIPDIGNNFITEMSNKQLMDLFKLSL